MKITWTGKDGACIKPNNWGQNGTAAKRPAVTFSEEEEELGPEGMAYSDERGEGG